MDRATFGLEMRKARALHAAGTGVKYGLGYMEGVERRHHGSEFGMGDEHRLWMTVKGDEAMESSQ